MRLRVGCPLKLMGTKREGGHKVIRHKDSQLDHPFRPLFLSRHFLALAKRQSPSALKRLRLPDTGVVFFILLRLKNFDSPSPFIPLPFFFSCTFFLFQVMFSRAIAIALLSLAISAQAIPNRNNFNFNKGKNTNNVKAQCSVRVR